MTWHPTLSPASRRRSALGLLLLAPALLTAPLVLACSGTGGGGPTAPGPPSAAQVESGSFALLNQARATAGLPALQLDGALTAIARAHSEAMRDRGFFDHRDPVTGKTFTDRLRDAGIAFRTAGENLAMVSNAADPAGFAQNSLFASPEHRADMLNPNFDRVGIGVAQAGNTYWLTQLFVGD